MLISSHSIVFSPFVHLFPECPCQLSALSLSSWKLQRWCAREILPLTPPPPVPILQPSIRPPMLENTTAVNTKVCIGAIICRGTSSTFIKAKGVVPWDPSSPDWLLSHSNDVAVSRALHVQSAEILHLLCAGAFSVVGLCCYSFFPSPLF